MTHCRNRINGSTSLGGSRTNSIPSSPKHDTMLCSEYHRPQPEGRSTGRGLTCQAQSLATPRLNSSCSHGANLRDNLQHSYLRTQQGDSFPQTREFDIGGDRSHRARPVRSCLLDPRLSQAPGNNGTPITGVFTSHRQYTLRSVLTPLCPRRYRAATLHRARTLSLTILDRPKLPTGGSTVNLPTKNTKPS